MAAGYHAGQAHRLLAAAAGKLVEHFRISTKLSIRATAAPVHAQAGRAVDELGTVPEVLLVHNPEHVLGQLPESSARQRWWAQLAATMAALTEQGVCRRWGVSSWDPRPLAPVLASSTGQAPPPQVLMVRAGLLVPAAVRMAGDALMRAAPASTRWGMAPFAGQAHLLNDIDLAALLGQPRPAASRLQIAAAAAWQLPAVSRLAVGASSREHLAELAAARHLSLDNHALEQCRNRLTGAPAR